MISTYTDLVAAVDDWLDLGGIANARIPTAIQMVEARLNRLLEDPNMEVATTLPLVADAATLPDDFGTLVSASFDLPGSANAYAYTISDGELQFDGAPPSSSAVLVYRRRIPALTASNPTNWLLTIAPDVYLYGCLVQIEGYDADDSRVSGWKSLYDEAVAELDRDGARRKWGAGPLGPRVYRP